MTFPFPFVPPTGVAAEFPEVVASASNTNTGTTEAADLPAGITSGDLVLVFLSGHAGLAVTTPSGWARPFYSELDGVNQTLAVYAKECDGSEGSSLVFTTGAPLVRYYASFRIIKHGGLPEASSVATGTSATPDPPNLSPTWGAQNCLWFAFGLSALGVQSEPAGYGNALSFGNGRLARRTAAGASENPGAFSQIAGIGWKTGTLGIRGA